MKKYLLFVLFCSLISNAQSQRFLYAYSFVPDSTNKADVHTEILVLDVNAAGSEFYSYEKFKSDSLLTAEIKKQANSGAEIINFTPTYKGKINYTVSKKYPVFSSFQHISVGNDEYIVNDDREIIWKITPEKKKILDFNAQKAESDMYGRKWTAWFATEIPIQDGPYKFQGLPGLIVKIEDHTKTHSFELKSITKQLDKSRETQEMLFGDKEIPVTYSQYKKMYLELRNDPTKSLRELINRSAANSKIIGPDGKEIKAADLIRERELRAKEDRRKNNNPLELDLHSPE